MKIGMKIGLMGTGLMGLAMVERLLSVQTPVVVYNRTAARLEPLQHTAATLTASPAELVQQCQGIITMLTDAQAIQAVLLTEETRPHLAGRTVIQMGTIGPQESRSLRDQIEAIGGQYLEAPVLGSIPEAKAGQLQIMVGATAAQFQDWLPLLQQLGTEPRLIGEVGTAAALKLALNQLIGSLTTGFALSLGLVRHQGVPVDAFMDILRQSALYAPTFDKKLQRMLDGNYANPNFPTKHLLKDVQLFLTEAIASGLSVDSLVGVQHILAKTGELGLADADYSALFAAIDPESGTKRDIEVNEAL